MDDNPLQVSLAPATAVSIEYYQTIERPIRITNVSDKPILIEGVALRFQSDFGVSTVPVVADCATELGPGQAFEHVAEVRPTALFLRNTNTFDIQVRYRFIEQYPRQPRRQVFDQPPYAYIMVREPAKHIGNLFISLKQPEDVELGLLLARMARRAGFEPFLKAENDRITEDIWKDTIEPALVASDVVTVIWTEQTHWKADGVRREIELCRSLGKREALLLAQDTAKPELYAGTTVEYKSFDPVAPAKAFGEVVDTLRQIVLERGTAIRADVPLA